MRFFLTLFVTILACSGAQSEQNLFPFTTDGCSMFIDSDWLQCCIEHDKKYWIGGTELEKKSADQELKECVRSTDNPKTSFLMYRGVRFGGSASFPTSFKWGYGWKEKRGYKEFTESELELINKYKGTTELPKYITTNLSNIIGFGNDNKINYCSVIDLQKNLLEKLQNEHSIVASYVTNIEISGTQHQYRVQVFSDQCINGFYIIGYNLKESCEIDEKSIDIQAIGECSITSK